MTWNEKIIAAHTAVTDQVSHLVRLSSERYFVWQEDGRNDLMADNIHAETAVTGTTDLFTKQEFDPWAEAFEAALEAMGIAWSFSSFQRESDTGFLHYEWNWEVTGDGDDPDEGA